MTSIKVDGFLRPFRGKVDDWSRFWNKFQVLASIQGWDTEGKRTKHLPLFLEGDAFLVYTRMADADKKKEQEIRRKMEQSFALTKAEAYRKFVTRKLKEDEPPDAYVADLQTLAALSGHNVEDDEDPMLIEQLIAGLPQDYAKELRLSMASKTLTISGCLDTIRALRTASSDAKLHTPDMYVAAATPSTSTGMMRSTESQVVCFHCQAVGHVRRNCPLLSSGRYRSGTELTCFFCDGRGHVKRHCPAREAWLKSMQQPPFNGNGTTAATKSIRSEDLCLCTTPANPGAAGLPKIFVDVRPVGATASVTRCKAAVDSCSTYTLVSREFVMQQSWEVTSGMTSETTIVGLDGQPLPLRGQVNLEMERKDTNVQLPLLEITALVVDSLDAVGTEILIGADAIAQSGGVRLRYDNRKRLDGVFFGRAVTAATANAASDPDAHPLRHVKETSDGDDVMLSTQDGEVRWDASAKKWVLSWQWKDGGPPKEPFGSGIGQYARNRLSAAEEQQFGDEVRGWIDNGWLVEHDPATHGDVATVLPLLAKEQYEEPLTRRVVFKWTGRLTSHYPVCSWLRPACAWLKRHSSEDRHWDEPVTNAIQDCCHELQERVLSSDPAKGERRVSSPNEGSWTVLCDASDIATGVVLQMDSKVIEDAAWLRAPKDKKHINITELDATIKGLTLAAEWNLKAVTVATDSKTVIGWLRQTFENASRVRVSGLHKALVLRRLHIIDDQPAVNKLTATVGWVPSDQNPADLLTRVPGKWLARTGTHANKSAHVCAASAGTGDNDLKQLTTVEEIKESQLSCPIIESVKADIAAGGTVSRHEFKRISQQLVESDGLLRREVRLPLEGLVSVPVIPEDLVERVLKAGHQTSGHARWNTMYSTLRSKRYFPRMAARCRLHVGECQTCQAASCQRGPVLLATRPDIPGRPWSSVQLDTPKLGAEKSGSYHCVLVCVDTFTKWVISKVLSPSTVVIENRDHRQKVVNAELIKRAAVDFDAEDSSQGESDNDAQEQMNYFEMEMVEEDRCP